MLLDQQGLEVLADQQETTVELDHQDLRDPVVKMVKVESKEPRDHQVFPEVRECQDQKEIRDQMDDQENQGHKVIREHEEKEVSPENRDRKDQLDLQDQAEK